MQHDFTRPAHWMAICLLVTLVSPQLCSGEAPSMTFVAAKIDAAKDSLVLCPSLRSVSELASKPADDVGLTYKTAKFVEAGDSHSKVSSLGAEELIPNQFIIPIPANQTAKVGDVVLTYWLTGHNMKRAIVVGGSPTQPVVRYLDGYVGRNDPPNDEQVTLPTNSFLAIGDELQVGSHVLFDKGSRFGKVVALSETGALVQHFMDSVTVVNRSDLELVPLRPNVKPGDQVLFSMYAGVRVGKVAKTDANIGRVFVEYESGGDIDVYAQPIGNVKKN